MSNPRKKSSRIGIRVSDKQRAHLWRQAKAMNMKVSAYVRWLILKDMGH